MHVFGLVEKGEAALIAFSFCNQRDLCLCPCPEQLSGKSVCVFHDIAFSEMIKSWIVPAIYFLFVGPDQAGVSGFHGSLWELGEKKNPSGAVMTCPLLVSLMWRIKKRIKSEF